MSGFGVRVSGFRFRVSGFGLRVSGFGLTSVVLSRRSKAVPPDETGVPGADPDPVPGAVPGVPVIT